MGSAMPRPPSHLSETFVHPECSDAVCATLGAVSKNTSIKVRSMIVSTSADTAKEDLSFSMEGTTRFAKASLTGRCRRRHLRPQCQRDGFLLCWTLYRAKRVLSEREGVHEKQYYNQNPSHRQRLHCFLTDTLPLSKAHAHTSARSGKRLEIACHVFLCCGVRTSPLGKQARQTW